MSYIQEHLILSTLISIFPSFLIIGKKTAAMPSFPTLVYFWGSDCGIKYEVFEPLICMQYLKMNIWSSHLNSEPNCIIYAKQNALQRENQRVFLDENFELHFTEKVWNVNLLSLCSKSSLWWKGLLFCLRTTIRELGCVNSLSLSLLLPYSQLHLFYSLGYFHYVLENERIRLYFRAS